MKGKMDSPIQTILKFAPLLTLSILLTCSNFGRCSARSPWSPHKVVSEGHSKNADHFKTHYYNQTLDHFNYNQESYNKFSQKYVLSSKHWRGASHVDPILVYFGAEAALSPPYDNFVSDIADAFHALVLMIEHRFYGNSIPNGLSIKMAMSNSSSVRGYFNSAQALADYTEIILHVKKEFDALYSPVVVFGGSYAGNLAAWFRLKYPHVAIGALASSAPVLYFDHITPQDGYYAVITKVFRGISETCYETIRDSWDEIDTIASKHDGLSILTNKFKLCSELQYPYSLKNFLIYNYVDATQYASPPVPKPIAICNAIDGAGTTDILDRIFAGMVASYDAPKECYSIDDWYTYRVSPITLGWGWQTCTEMIMPIGTGPNSPMFQPRPFDWNEHTESCNRTYGVVPRVDWVINYYGGHDIKLVLERFGSNIIFSNGLWDPYSCAGVLENISDTIVALKTENGSHCMDIVKADPNTDPEWLISQRKEEVQIIKGWIDQYYADLKKI